MILRSVTPINWGPFANRTRLDLEQDVTVLTAANDAGKSSLLRLIDIAYQYPNLADVRETDLNQYYRQHSKFSNWRQDGNFGCEMIFEVTESTSPYVYFTPDGVMVPGDEVKIIFNLAPDKPSVKVSLIRDNVSVGISSVNFIKMPHVIGLPTDVLVRDIIDLHNANHAERLLLQMAFGRGFNAEKIINYSKSMYRNALSQAQKRFDAAVAQVIPSSLSLQFVLDSTGNQAEIAVQPFDREYGYAPLGVRGTGVKVLLSLLASLMEANAISDNILIHIDEPEKSLHADAQHLLRKLLEEIARRKTIQIIYVTHSPAMINNMRPRSVRLLERKAANDYVTTDIVERPIDNNFMRVRMTLGMSPSDSLQFAPVTIVVEGASEALGIIMLLEKLNEFNVEGFEDVPLIAPLCHVADGEGDSYVKLAKFAVSQKSQVVVFLDGDKNLEQRTITDLPDVAFIKLSDNREIEQLLSEEVYFMALQSSVNESGAECTDTVDFSTFERWLLAQPERTQRKAFSKQVDSWLGNIAPDFDFRKPNVFKAAVSRVQQPDEIRQTELRELISEIIKRLPSKE